MGKKSRSKKNKPKKIYPDEVYDYGVIQIARYGKNLILSNQMSDDEQMKFLSAMNESHKEIFKEIEEKISSLQKCLTIYNPAVLMHRAAYTVFPLFLQYTSETEFRSEEAFYLPGVEYIQYLLSRSKPAKVVKNIIEEHEWNDIWNLTIQILSLTKRWINTRPTFETPPNQIDELRLILDGKRLMVRVDRFGYFLKEYWNDTLLPYNNWISELYRLNSKELVEGLNQIAEYQKEGLVKRYFEMMEVGKNLQNLFDENGYNYYAVTEDELNKNRTALETNFKKEYEEMNEKMQLALTPALFDITGITSLPTTILDLLSIEHGESEQNDFKSNDDISPLSNSLLHSKPFLKYKNRYYHFFHTGLEDRVGEIIEADILKKNPNLVDSLMERRGTQLEKGAMNQLEKLLSPDVLHENIYYPNPDDESNITELDGLLILDDILFLVECKAGKFSEAASRGAPKSLLKDISELIIEGQRQSERAERYIKSSESVVFFDETGKNEVCKICSSDYRIIFRIVVTREPIGWVGAKISRLSVLDKTVLDSPPWHIAIDDLKIVADIFKDRGPQFCQYLELRLKAAENEKLDQADEIDQIGVYLDRNFYHDSDFDTVSRFSYTHFGKIIDDYYAAKLRGETPDELQQYMPEYLYGLVKSITKVNLKGRCELIRFIFFLNKEGRGYLNENLTLLKSRFSQGRRSSIRIPIHNMDQGLSITYATDDDYPTEIERSAAMMKSAGVASWIILRLSSPSSFKIVSIDKIYDDMIPENQLASAIKYMNDKVASIALAEKIGRNDPCPCGSSRKYKKCHGK